MQSRYEEFTKRGVEVLLISVDEPAISKKFVKKLGLSFLVGSDPEQKVIGAYNVINPDAPELAIHSVFVLDSDRRVLYRKIGRRRPESAEILDVLDGKNTQCCPGRCSDVQPVCINELQ